MDYDTYKERIYKINNIKNNILKFKWLILGILALIVISFSTFSFLKGRVMHVSYSQTLTYGDELSINSKNYFDSNVSIEYSSDSSDDWSSTKPTLSGKYKFRVISNGLFKRRISKSYYFEIEKKKISIDVTASKITYGQTPTYQTDGLLTSDSLKSLTFNYQDKTLSNTLMNLELNSVTIINQNNEDVSSCYEITSNTTNGKEITFKPLDLILEPTIENKEYDGTPITSSNTYTILNNKEAGYSDVISIETSFLNGSEEIDAPSVVGDYKLKIDKYLINGSDNQNYNISTVLKDFSITKRNITIKTNDATKVYDGTSLSSNEYSLESGTLVLDHKIDIINNTNIINYGETSNKLEAVIKSNEEDVTSNYSIRYNYGTLSVTKKTINYITQSKESVYDNTSLEAPELESIDELINDDTYRIINHTTLVDANEVDNHIELEIVDSLGNISYNYELNEICGKLTVKPADVTIKPLDRISETYIGEVYSNPKNEGFEIVSGKFYKNELESVDLIYSNDLYLEAINAGTYKVSIVRRDDLTNYNITYLDNTFEIVKALVTLKPVDVTSTFNYQNATIDNSKFEVVSGTLYGNDKEAINLIIDYYANGQKVDSIYHASDYKLVPTSFTSSNELISNNYDISFEDGTYALLKKDVDISISNQTVTYKHDLYQYAETISSTDDKIIPSIKLNNSHSSDTLLNASDYALYIDSYEFIDTIEFVRDDFNISTVPSTFTIKPLDVELKVANVLDTTYDGNIQELDGSCFEIVKGTLYDDVISVNIIDKDTKTIKNADTYNLLINGYTTYNPLVNKNYNITFSDETYLYTINPKTINLTTYDETYEYDGSNHSPDASFTLSSELYNNDTISLVVNIENEIDVAKYEKNIQIVFNKGLDDSKEENYEFIKNTSYLEITKRHIVLKLNDVNEIYYAHDSLNDIRLISYHYDDNTKFGISSCDTIIYSTNYDSLCYPNVGEYKLNIVSYSIKRESIDKKDNYEIEKKESSLTIVKRKISIKPIDKLDIIYNKRTVSYDDSLKCIIDYNNQPIDKLPDNETFTINSHFEQESNIVSAINAGKYDVIIDSINANAQVFNNYDISYLSGQYIILPKPVSAYIEEQIRYDALVHSVSLDDEVKYENNDGFIEISHLTYEVTSTDKYKDVGKYNFKFEIIQLDGDLLSNYEITYLESKSTLIIIPRDLSVKLVETYYTYNDKTIDSTSYDSNQLSLFDDNDKVYLDSANAMFKEVIGLELSIKMYIGDFPKNVGDYLILIDKVGHLRDSSLDKNYNLTKSSDIESFHIVKRHLVARFDSFEAEYDGKNQANTFKYTIIKDLNEKVERVNSTGYSDALISYDLNDIEIINAGIYERTLLNYDFGDNLEIEFENLSTAYTINKRHIIIKPAGNDDLTFNNEVLTLNNIYVYDDSFDSNNENYKLDYKNIKVTLSEKDDKEIKDAGKYTIKISSYTQDPNYDIETTEKEIEVKKRKQIIYTCNQSSVTYDSLMHSYDGTYQTYDVLSGNYYDNSLFAGFDLSVTAQFYQNGVCKGYSVKNAYEYSVLIDNYTSAYLNNFDIEIDSTYKTFVIEQYELHVMYQNKKVYDGISLESNSTISSNIILLNSLPDTIKRYDATIKVLKDNQELSEALNCGTYDIDITQVQLFTETEEVSNNYKLISYLGTLTITQRKLYVSLNDTSLVYNGISLSNKYEYYTLKDESGNEVLLEEFEIYVKYMKDLSYTDPLGIGEYNVIFDYYNTSGLNELNNSFELKDNAILTITRAIINITFTKDINSIYGDNIEFNEYISYTSNTVNQYKFDFVFNIDGNSNLNTLDCASYILSSDNLSNITSYSNGVLLNNEYVTYTLENETNLNISKRDITIKFDSYKKDYDASRVSDSDLSYTISNLPDFESNLSISDIIYVDTLNNIKSPVHAISYYVNNINVLTSNTLNKDVTSNYNVEIDNDIVIEISPIKINASIEVINREFEYDGLSHRINCKITPTNILLGDEISFNEINSKIFAGKYAETLEIDDIISTIGSNKDDYSIDYSIKYTITKRNLVLTTASTSFVYDGLEHNYNVTDSILGLAETDTYKSTSNDKFKNADEYKNELTYTIYNNDMDVTGCYEIIYNLGTITINKRDLSVSSKDESIVYSGYQKYQRSTYTIVDNYNNLSFDIDSKNNTFKISTTKFTTEINSELTESIYQASKVIDSFEIIIKNNNADVTSNFNISYACDSYFEVTPYEIVINVKDTYSKVYDGKEVDTKELLEEFSPFDSYNVNSIITNESNEEVKEMIYAGNYKFNLNYLSFYHKENDEEIDVTDSYHVTYQTNECIINIDKESITIKTNSYEYMWDGSDKSDESEPLVLKNNRTYKIPLGIPSYTKKAILKAYDESDNKLLSNKITNSLDFDKSLLNNYDIISDFGDLSFVKVYSLTYDEKKVYDGNPVIKRSINGSETINNTDVTYSVSIDSYELNSEGVDEMLYSGSYRLIPNLNRLILTVNEIDITYQEILKSNIELNYNFVYQITPKEILVTVSNQELEYNGTYQTFENIESGISYDKGYELVSTDKLIIIPNVTLTTCDETDRYNISEFKVINQDGEDVTNSYILLNNHSNYSNKSKYQIMYKISKLPLDITAEQTDFKYDGLEHSLSGVVVSNLIQGHTYKLVSQSQCDKYTPIEIYDEYNNNVTENYDIALELKILKLTLSMATQSDSKVYDGTSLSCIGYTLNEYKDGIKMDGLRSGDYIEVVEWPSITKAGKSKKNKPDIKIRDSSGKDVTDIYNWKTYSDWGTLTITK